MHIVQGDRTAERPAVRHRGGGVRARILLEGTPGRPDNFQFSLGLTGRDFLSPRHRHNFEQYRCVLQGRYDFGADGSMTAGMVGYFPEGVYYGPQSSADDTLAAVLQFGGVSGSGYLSLEEVESGMQALARIGEFRDGIFRREDGAPGRRNQDAFEAIWESVNGRPLVYPSSSHAGPSLVDPDALRWAPVDGSRASQKRLGDFAANDTAARLLRLESGTALEVTGRGIYLALSGAGRVDEEPLRPLTAVYLEAAERTLFAAAEPTVLLHYELPVLR